jgi:hypothetical protein
MIKGIILTHKDFHFIEIDVLKITTNIRNIFKEYLPGWFPVIENLKTIKNNDVEYDVYIYDSQEAIQFSSYVNVQATKIIYSKMDDEYIYGPVLLLRKKNEKYISFEELKF